MSDIIKNLEEIFGTENVSVSEVDKLMYSFDASQREGKTQVVVWPKNALQIQELIKYALNANLDIVPRGGGTGLVGGCVPNNSIVVDVSKMNKIENINLKEKEVLVQAGLVIKDLNDELKEHNLFFPIIPSSHKICQIGGIIATNAAGIRAIHYGKTDKWIKEIQIINGNGDNLTIKDPTEICGSEGILGIIIGAKLKLTDILEKRTLTVKTFDDIDRLCESVEKVAGNKNITAIEFFGKHTAEIADIKSQYHLFIEYNNDDGEIKEINKINELLNLRKGLGPLIGSKKYTVVEDPKIPMNKLPDFLRWLEENKIPVFGHIGIGIFHPRFKPDQDKLIIEMFELVKKLGGCVSGEHGIGLAKKKNINSKAIERFKILKKKYDPKNIFNRGKIYD